MTFDLQLYDKTEISDEYEDGKRFYVTPVGRFKSVTTVIGEHFGTEYLDEWRKRVGHAEAERVGNIAKRRGTEIHKLCEQYILGNPHYKRKAMPVNLATFLQMKPHLDTSLGTVYGIEYPLYSKNLKTAGRTDLIAEYNGKLSIVDFKTSKKLKNENLILNYFIQATCYAVMAKEVLNIDIEQLVIIIAVDEDNSQVFIKKTSDYVDMMYNVFGGSNENLHNRGSILPN